MKIATFYQQGVLGHAFQLTLEADITPGEMPDLEHDQALDRAQMVLRRELNRCAEILSVALKDAQAARARGPAPPPTGPAQTVQAGTKDPDGLTVNHKEWAEVLKRREEAASG